MKNMPTVWFSLKKSLHCKSEPSEVHDPKTRRHLSTILTRKPGRSGCSRSISNLRDVIHGSTSKRHVERPPSCSPRSIGSSDFLNPITHEVILGATNTCELKISGFSDGPTNNTNSAGPGPNGPAFVGTLRPGTPGPGGQQGMHYFNNPSFRAAASNNNARPSSRRISLDAEAINGSRGSSANVTCHKCGEQFAKWEAAESHHLSKHAVTELIEGDSSRKIVEIICRTSWPKSESQCTRIERVLKVHNMQKTLARFEAHRESVKSRASKLAGAKKHPRCIADGNELLRFHGTTVACRLGLAGASALCSDHRCCVCRIIRHGFSGDKSDLAHGVGVFTTSTSGRAFESIVQTDSGDDVARKALIVCRVIAGRVHRPLENVQEITSQTGFDSLAGKVGLYSNIEELYLLNPIALLPCFVVICKP